MLASSVESKKREDLYGKATKIFMGIQVADGAVAGEGRTESFLDQPDHHVTRSLLYVWWQLYRERGETACVPSQAFHASTRG